MDKNSRHDEDEEIEFEPTPIPVSPDGGIDGSLASSMIGHPPAVPERTPNNFVCLRGPCKHYWHLVTMAQEGNPQDTWDHLGIAPPRQHHHTCLVNPGYETAFSDDNAFECSRWEPYTETELNEIQKRRNAYHEREKTNNDE